jgi:hypothetical protein
MYQPGPPGVFLFHPLPVSGMDAREGGRWAGEIHAFFALAAAGGRA